MRRPGRKSVALVGVLAAAMVMTAACSTSNNNGGSSGNEQITLKVRLFGTFGYKEQGLFDKYTAEHPNIKIDYTTVQQEQDYWTALQSSLATGAGLGDLVGIEVGRVSTFVDSMTPKFKDLNQYGAADLKGDFYPWKWAATEKNGKQYGLGTDIGPLALCYRADLFKQAGLPDKPADVAKLWDTTGWDGFITAGKQYMTKAPAKSFFVDTAGGFFNAIIGQSATQYYDASGNLVVATNPVVKKAWDYSMQMATNNLTAKLAQFSPDWNTAFTSGSFATIACPSWMIGYIKGQAANTSGKWDVAPMPGGTGNWGGSYLAVPDKAAHPKEAYELAKWLTSSEQEVTLFVKGGNFPSNSKAAQDTQVKTATDAYFSGGGSPAPIGQIFGDSAAKMVPQITGPHDGDIKTQITTAITRVETGQQKPDDAWKQVIEKDIPNVVK
jgi:cellobiose transport system substrate-binding protein